MKRKDLSFRFPKMKLVKIPIQKIIRDNSKWIFELLKFNNS